MEEKELIKKIEVTKFKIGRTSECSMLASLIVYETKSHMLASKPYKIKAPKRIENKGQNIRQTEKSSLLPNYLSFSLWRPQIIAHLD